MLLPAAELTLAGALLLAPMAGVAATGTIALLALFSLLVVRTLRRGEAPDCHCFGQVGGGPVGRGTLLRNAALALVALAVMAGGPGYSLSDAARELGDRPPAERVLLVGGPILLVVVLGLSRMVFQLLAQQGRLHPAGRRPRGSLRRPSGRDPRAPAPAFTLPDPDGRLLSLAELVAGAGPSCRRSPTRTVVRVVS